MHTTFYHKLQQTNGFVVYMWIFMAIKLFYFFKWHAILVTITGTIILPHDPKVTVTHLQTGYAQISWTGSDLQTSWIYLSTWTVSKIVAPDMASATKYTRKVYLIISNIWKITFCITNTEV